jgi:hypothetical protein
VNPPLPLSFYVCVCVCVSCAVPPSVCAVTCAVCHERYYDVLIVYYDAAKVIILLLYYIVVPRACGHVSSAFPRHDYMYHIL